MPKPTTEPVGEDYISSKFEFFEMFANAKSAEDIKSILSAYFTESELLLAKRRFYIKSLLDKGMTIRQVASRIKCSTQTVLSVKSAVRDRIRATSGEDKKLDSKEGEKTVKKSVIAKKKYYFG